MSTILIVEDEIVTADKITRLLTRLGYQALEPVTRNEEALQVLSRPAGSRPELLAAAGPGPQLRDYLFVRKEAAYVKVLLREILYFEALQNYVRLHTVREKFVFDSTLKKLAEKLPAQFLKVHRSYIVNLDHVQAYEEGCVELGTSCVPVSRSCREELKSRIYMVG
ncbi:hypothetical protein GCM10027346_36000 [Hymenobacter seoulensis]